MIVDRAAPRRPQGRFFGDPNGGAAGKRRWMYRNRTLRSSRLKSLSNSSTIRMHRLMLAGPDLPASRVSASASCFSSYAVASAGRILGRTPRLAELPSQCSDCLRAVSSSSALARCFLRCRGVRLRTVSTALRHESGAAHPGGPSMPRPHPAGYKTDKQEIQTQRDDQDRPDPSSPARRGPPWDVSFSFVLTTSPRHRLRHFHLARRSAGARPLRPHRCHCPMSSASRNARCRAAVPPMPERPR